MNNTELIGSYIDWAVTRKGNQPLTMYQYKLKLEDLASWIAPASLMEIGGEVLDQWVRREVRNKPNSASTQAKDVTICKGFFDFLMRKGLRRDDPTIDLLAPKIRNKQPRPVSDEIWQAWYAYPHTDPDALLYMGLGYLIGLRRAEITRLTCSHVNPRTLVISNLVRKGGGDDALHPRDMVAVVAQGLPHLLPDDGERWLQLLAHRVRRGSGPLFAWADSQRVDLRKPENVLGDDTLDPQWVYRRINRWARESRLEKWKPHDLRHSCATNLLRCDVPVPLVSRLMDHADIGVTLTRYAKVSGSELRRFVQNQGGQNITPISRFGRQTA